MITGKTLRDAIISGANNIANQRTRVDELNVFPVPDGDTGTNMSMTIGAALSELNAMPDTCTVAEASKSAASAMLRGARGNSGVITSLLFRGFSKALAGKTDAEAADLAKALQMGVEAAYKAVMKPKEGTILTVAKGIAQKAAEMAEVTDDLEEFLPAVLAYAKEVLDQTPEMLPVLKQAGVVDSGGQGLVQVLKGAYDALIGKEIDYTIEGAPTGAAPAKISAETEAEIKFGYCTEFIIVLNAPMSDNEEHAYKAFLESIGDSIVVVADDEIVKTHVHTNDPGLALQKALTFGSLSKIKIDNMREEHQEKLIKDSQKLAAQQKAEEEAYEAALADEKTNNMPAKEMGFVSVSIGEGMNEVFRGLGVDYLIEGGQTMNPSTEDMLNAIEHVNAKTVFILPNNKNIIMAANQAVDLVEDKQIIVIPTKTIPQGITALVNYIPDHSAEENKEQMMAEIENVKTGQVTYAVRDTEIDGKTIKQNDFMGIGDKSILSVGTDLRATTLEMVDAMVDEDSAIVSIYFGSDSDEDSANELAAAIEEKYPDVEVEVNDGGQPIYYYVISVE